MSTTVIRGGKHVAVTKLLPDNTEAAASVFVRKVPFLRIETLARAWGKPAEELAVYTDLKPGEIEELTPESQALLFKEGRDLNFFTLKAFNDETDRTFRALGGEQVKIAEKITAQMMQNAASPDSGVTSSPPASPSQS